MNESKIIKLKGFGVKNTGAINLGIAAPLFVPMDSSRLSSRGENATEADQTHDYLNMTRNLLQALQPSKKQNYFIDNEDNFLQADEENGIDLVDVEYPTSFAHLTKILLKTDIKNWLYLSNPDGYFYYIFIKICIKLFLCSLVVAFAIQWSLCEDDMFCRLDLEEPNVYQTYLGATISVSFIAFYFLCEFCMEMMNCEFQPDKQIMDQFISLHTLLIRGINQEISADVAERGIGKIFIPRFGSKNILKIEAFRPIKNLKQLNSDRKLLKRQLRKTKKINKKAENGERVQIRTGSTFSVQHSDAEIHYKQKIGEIDQSIEKIQNESAK